MNFLPWFTVIVAVTFTVIAATVFSYFFFKQRQDTMRKTIVSGVVALVAAAASFPALFWVANTVNLNNRANFLEFWNGLETEAGIQVTKCERDGSCVHEYDCDPYWDTIAVHTDEGIEYETVLEYHSCPYVTEELTYYISDSFGDTHYVSSNQFSTDPVPFRESVSIPARVPTEVPELWVAAKSRLDAGEPGGVTKMVDYNNWVLAVQESILHKFSSEISEYREAGLFPVIAHNVYDFYSANKVYTVGLSEEDLHNYQEWVTELQRFNGYLGPEKQGDLHVVIVNTSMVGNPDKYSQALNAYWQSTEYMGHNTLSKNGVVLVVGVHPGVTAPAPLRVTKESSHATGNVVKWVRGFTGMPEGNEKLKSTVSSPLFVQQLAREFNDVEKVFSLDSGVMKQVFDNYKRVHMKDYEYLKNSINLGLLDTIAVMFAALLVTAVSVFAAYKILESD